MDCYICDPKTQDTGECESCRYDLYPLQEYMREVTGDSSFTDHGALSAVNSTDQTKINAWLAGAQLPYECVRIGGNFQVKRVDKVNLTFVTHETSELLAVKQQHKNLTAAIHELLSEHGYDRSSIPYEEVERLIAPAATRNNRIAELEAENQGLKAAFNEADDLRSKHLCRVVELEEEAEASDMVFDVMLARIERYEAALRKITWLTVVSHDLPAAQKIARDALEGE